MFLVSVVRMIIGAMGREYRAGGPAAGTVSQGQPRAEVPNGGELLKSPSCGTYHAVANIAGKTKAGMLVHFCSADCRDKYAA